MGVMIIKLLFTSRVSFTCGFNYHSRRRSNVISELQLTADCTMKELWQMAEPREGHGAELLGHDKVLILGGEKSTNCKGVLESVLEFDSTKNECKKMPPFPCQEWGAIK